MSEDAVNADNHKPLNVINLLASLAFLLGSTLFLPTFSSHATIGVYLFMLGSTLMLVETLRAWNYRRV